VAKESAIEWTDATFNPWWGCERVSPACAHCYADAWARRAGFEVWDNATHRFFGDTHWRKPLHWNRDAEEQQKPMFVFCASMADVFEPQPTLDEQRERLWELIDVTPWLVWLLLTKRPEQIADMVPWPEAPPNVWLGTSIENARHSYRAELLRESVPCRVHFLSCEPLLGSLYDNRGNRRALDLEGIEWVIAGGESGPRFRPMNLDHARELRDHCRQENVPYFLKQIGGRWPKQNGKSLDGREWCERPTPEHPARTLSLF
jgi:protein gp37